MFDYKLTTYKILDEISDAVEFITLRKRNKKLLADTLKIPSEHWKHLKLDIPKRKHKMCSVYESVIQLPRCETQLRQMVIKNHGRAEPTFVITNHHDLLLKEVLRVYAKRWHIENKDEEREEDISYNLSP